MLTEKRTVLGVGESPLVAVNERVSWLAERLFEPRESEKKERAGARGWKDGGEGGGG